MTDQVVLNPGDPARAVARDRVLRLAAAGGATGEVTDVIKETLPGEVLPTDSLAELAWMLHLTGLALAALAAKVAAAEGRDGPAGLGVIRAVLDEAHEE